MRIFKSYRKFIRIKYKNFDIFKLCNLNILNSKHVRTKTVYIGKNV